MSISNHSNQKIENLDNNLKAARDSVETIMLENGNLLAEKSSYIIKEKELYDIIDITKKEKKEIEKKLNDKIAYIADIESNIKIDTVETIRDSIIYIDSTMFNRFNYDSEWLSFNGISNLKTNKTNIFDINIPAPLKFGLTDDYKVFVESENPYLNISYINGTVIDGSNLHKNKSKWNIGIQGGFGAQYGFIKKQFDMGIYIGFGINYNFF